MLGRPFLKSQATGKALYTKLRHVGFMFKVIVAIQAVHAPFNQATEI